MADDLTVVLPDDWPGSGRSVIVLWPDEEVLGWPDVWSCGQTTLAVQGQTLDNLGRRVAKRFDRGEADEEARVVARRFRRVIAR